MNKYGSFRQSIAEKQIPGFNQEFLPRRDYNLERQQLNGIGHRISTSQDVRKVANGCMVELLKVLNTVLLQEFFQG